MRMRSISLTAAGALALTLATAPASSQPYRPDAEGYPCQKRQTLRVTEMGSGFAITLADAPPQPAQAPIALGSTLKFDPAMLRRSRSDTAKGGKDADAR